MQSRAISVLGIRQSQSSSRSFKLQDTVASKSVSEANRTFGNLGNIISHGGFGLIYLGIILPMYVLLKLVELGPCDLPFFTGSASIAYICYSIIFTTKHIQVSN